MAIKVPGVGWVGGVDAERVGASNTQTYNNQLLGKSNPSGVGGVAAERILQAAIDAEIRALVNAKGPGGVSAYDGGQHAAAYANTAYNNAVAGGQATPNVVSGGITGYQEMYGQPAPNAGGNSGGSSEPPWQVIGSGGVQSSGRGTPPNTPTFGSLLSSPATGGAAGPQNQGSGSLPGGGAALLFGAPNGNSSRIVR